MSQATSQTALYKRVAAIISKISTDAYVFLVEAKPNAQFALGEDELFPACSGSWPVFEFLSMPCLGYTGLVIQSALCYIVYFSTILSSLSRSTNAGLRKSMATCVP